ncbi:hypothetical protein WJU23_14380 [Prosthecobacter sp. SYSU 5D2]|uniref:hypothetical protein n=1 Tax=Prosthecobacter sp. SYSU 5D2 TaxID=3134134 RepID=UPI0031FE7B5C
MFGLTSLGAIHTLIGLVALFAGAVALVRDHTITANNKTGRLYVITTVLTCLTGFGIYENGGFGAPHVLGIITLAVLWLGWAAEHSASPAQKTRIVATVSYSATFFFHWIPTITEGATRLPLGAPLVAEREGPEIQAAVGVAFVLFVIGTTMQVMAIRRRAAAPGFEVLSS